MKEAFCFFIGAWLGIVLVASIKDNRKQTEEKILKEAIQIEQNMQKQAISHGVAHYEVDTNGVVSFKWNK